MKLVVCGCSWSSRDHAYPDTEYGYFISNELGWDYQNIARVGGSNFNIRLQIDYAIKNLNPDFIVVNWTTPDRFDWNHRGNLYEIEKGLKQSDYNVDKFFTNEWNHPCYPDVEPTIMHQSMTGLVTYDDFSRTYEEACVWWDNLPAHMNKAQWESMKTFYINLYDTDLEAHKQYYMMESAVNQMQRANVPFLFCPNTFNWKQNIQERYKLTDEQKEQYYIDGLTYDFVPEKNLQLYTGIADALAWDYETMEDPIGNPTHNHCHHLSANAHKRWATEIAIPKIKQIL
jgi:hypothetical protein